jgi:hypothetical protein
MADFNCGLLRIRNSAPSSEVVVGYARFALPIGSRGKSGGARVIYYWAVRKNVILLLYAYPKNAAADLTPKQVSQLAKVVKEEFGSEKTNV